MTAKPLKLGTTVNTPKGRGTISDYADQKTRVGGWDGHNERVRTYYVVLDGDVHHRPFKEDEIFETIEAKRSKEDINRRLHGWGGTACVTTLLWSDIEEAANHIAQLRSALEMFYDPDDRTDRGKTVHEALNRYDTEEDKK